MHSLSRAVNLTLYSLDIRFPHCVGLSIRMADIMTEKNAFATNITLSHFDTSLTQRNLTLVFCSQLFLYYQKFTEKASKKNLFLILYLLFPFLGKTVKIRGICQHIA